jgi:hypothetical protein
MGWPGRGEASRPGPRTTATPVYERRSRLPVTGRRRGRTSKEQARCLGYGRRGVVRRSCCRGAGYRARVVAGVRIAGGAAGENVNARCRVGAHSGSNMTTRLARAEGRDGPDVRATTSAGCRNRANTHVLSWTFIHEDRRGRVAAAAVTLVAGRLEGDSRCAAGNRTLDSAPGAYIAATRLAISSIIVTPRRTFSTEMRSLLPWTDPSSSNGMATGVKP